MTIYSSIKMVEDLKQHFTLIQFDQIPRMNNRVANAMATIGSLLQMLANSQKCKFLVVQLFILAYDVLESEMVCVLIGSDSPRYQETFTNLQDNVIPHQTQQQTFIRRCTYYTILVETLF